MPHQNAYLHFIKLPFAWLQFVLLIAVTYQPFAFAQTVQSKNENDDQEGQPNLHLMRRINAHGDEYNAIVLSPDERQLIIGTEKGDLIVWSIEEQRITKRFNQGSPIHTLVMLGDGRRVVTAGGPHGGSKRAGIVRCWNLDSGAFQEWRGLESDTIGEMAIDHNSGLLAAGAADGHIAVWSAETGKLEAAWKLEKVLVGLAVIGHNVFATAIDQKALEEDSGGFQANSILVFNVEKPKEKARRFVPDADQQMCIKLVASPDGKRLAVNCLSKELHSQIALLDSDNGTRIERFDASCTAWFANDGLILYNSDAPERLVRLNAEGKTSIDKQWETGAWHGGGDPTDLGGLVASREGLTVWGVFKKGAAIARWTAEGNRGEILAMTHGGIFAMDVIEPASGAGLLLTSGDDGFARVWNLADLSLRGEFKVPAGVPQGVALLKSGRQAVVSCSTDKSPTEIIIASTATGAQRKLLSIDQPFVRVYAAGEGFIYNHGSRVVLASATDGKALREFAVGSGVEKFAASANGKWLAIADEDGKLYVFEIASGRKTVESKGKVEALTAIAITNDGRWVITTEFQASLKLWDVQRGDFETLTGIRGQCRSLSLSSDERFILVGGNHRDFSIYDATSGDKLAAFDTEAADFSVTGVWMKGDRLIFTTDTGVLLEGKLDKHDKPKER